MSTTGSVALDPDSKESGSNATTLNSSSRFRRTLRKSGPAFALAPFFIYTFLGLGIPTLGVIYKAFQGEHGGFTFTNLDQVVHGVYLTGFENSFKLAFLSSVIPGILGVFLAYAIQTSKSSLLRRLVTSVSGVFANFGGVNLTFMFVATLGTTGLLTFWLNAIKLNPWHFGFDLYTFSGVVFVYMYFQIPLMVLVITPALVGLRESWREAAENMGASSLRYWYHVGVPVLLPSILGGMLLLFGSAFAAYATAESLTTGIIALSPIQIGNFINGNVISGEANAGYAIAFGMLVILSVTMILYGLIRKRASRWLL
jgi:putative spermidine/putrescine transport system permease protein